MLDRLVRHVAVVSRTDASFILSTPTWISEARRDDSGAVVVVVVVVVVVFVVSVVSVVSMSVLLVAMFARVLF